MIPLNLPTQGKVLNENNDQINYIPVVNDLYSDEIKEQIYSNIIRAKHIKMKEAFKTKV